MREVSDEMAACAADKHPELGGLVPPESFQAMMQAWATLHGITCLDAYGQFDWMSDEAREELFVATLRTAALAGRHPGRLSSGASAPVVLHGPGVADAGVLGVLAELPARSSLAQQVPALDQLDLDTGQVGVLGLAGDRTIGTLLAQPVLLLDQALDPALHVLVAHDARLALPTAGTVGPAPRL